MDFDIKKVYTTLNADEVKVGSKGYFADDLTALKEQVSSGELVQELAEVKNESNKFRFITEDKCAWQLFYLVEESKEDILCTEQELVRWLAEGKGLYKDCVDICSSGYCFRDGEENKTVDKHTRVRKWDDPEWHRPSRKYMGLE